MTLALVHLGLAPRLAGRGAELAVLDVGQGLSVAYRDPLGLTALVDTGGVYGGRWDPGRRVAVPFVLERWGRRLDILALTHDDHDHVAGAEAVLRSLDVGALWIPPHAGPATRRAVDVAHALGTAVVLAERGHSDGPVAVLAPDRGTGLTRRNDRSLVLQLGRAPHRALVPGDLGRAGVDALLSSAVDPSAELLVLAHHGARDGTDERLLRSVRPRLAACSAGRENRFGHPHPDVQSRLRRARVPLLRTDRQGTIELVVSDRGWREVSR